MSATRAAARGDLVPAGASADRAGGYGGAAARRRDVRVRAHARLAGVERSPPVGADAGGVGMDPSRTVDRRIGRGAGASPARAPDPARAVDPALADRDVRLLRIPVAPHHVGLGLRALQPSDRARPRVVHVVHLPHGDPADRDEPVRDRQGRRDHGAALPSVGPGVPGRQGRRQRPHCRAAGALLHSGGVHPVSRRVRGACGSPFRSP